MTYIRTANGFVRVKDECEADLLKPIDYSDPQVIKNILEFKERIRRGNERFIQRIGKERYERYMRNMEHPEMEYMDSKISQGMQEEFEEMWEDAARPQRQMPAAHHHRTASYACVDCPRYDGRRCTKRFDDEPLCDEIEERFRERI